MSVQELKAQLHKAINEIKDEALLQQIQAVINASVEYAGEGDKHMLAKAEQASLAVAPQEVDLEKASSFEKAKEQTRQTETQAENDSEDTTDWQDSFLNGSIISREDEKNVQRIWKSPGGC